MLKLVRICLIILTLQIFGLFANAAPSSLTYQGRILKSDGTPLEYTAVSFQFEITSPDGLCVLYREQVNGISMVNSGGVFDVPIGLGTQSYPSSGTFTLLDAFNNTGTLNCDGGATLAPQFDDVRKLRVKFHDGTGWKTISPDSTVRSVPYAGFSYSSAKLGTNSASDFVLKTGIPTCAVGTFLSWDGTAMSCSGVAGASGGTVTNVTSANSYLTIINGTSTPALTLNVGVSANTVAAGNDARFTDARTPMGSAGGDLTGSYPNPAVAKIQGVDVSNVAPTAGQFFKFASGKWTASIIDITDVNNLSTTMSGYQTQAAFNTAVGSANCTNYETPYWSSVSGKFLCQAINVSLAGDASGSIGSVSVDKIKGIPVGAAAPTAGQVLKYDGTKWAPGADINAGGTVTSVTSANSYLTVATGTTTPALTLNVGTAANTVAAGNDTRIVNAVQNTGNATNITVDTTANKPVSGAVGQIYITNDAGAIFVGTGGGWKTVGTSDAGFMAGGTLPIARGGTGGATQASAFNNLAPTTTKGDLISFDGTNNVRVAVGTNGQVLTADSSAAGGVKWSTAASGTVTSVTGTSPVMVATGTSTPVISVNDATTTTKGIVQVGSGLSVTGGVISTTGAAPTGTAGGDLSGTYPNPTLAKISGTALSISSLTTKNYLKYDGTNWLNSLIAITDVTGLSTSLSGKPDFTQFAICSAAQTLTYVSPVGGFVCTSIAIGDSAITYGSQSAKTFFAAPTGGAGTPTFRTIATADLPSGGYDTTYFKTGGNAFGAASSIGNTDNYNMTFKTNNLTRMTIDKNGSIGVGTQGLNWYDFSVYKANADSVAAVVSENTSGSTAHYPTLNVVNYAGSPAAGAAGNAVMNLINLRGTSGASATMLSGESLGAVAFNGSYSTNGNYRSGASIWAQTAQDFSSGSGSDLVFQTATLNATSDSEKMRLTNAGYLGIGTGSTPLSALHVNNNNTSGVSFRLSSTDTGGRAYGLISSGSASSGGAGKLHLYDYTAPRSLMVFDSSGNAGIGTTTPAYLLDIRNSTNVGQLHISGTGGDDGLYAIATNVGVYHSAFASYNGSAWTAKAALSNVISQDTNGVSFYVNSGLTAGSTFTPTQKMTVATTGVGIGTLTPTQALTLNGNFLMSTAGSKILADFTNATPVNRTWFQTSAIDSNTVVGAIPSNSGGTNANPGAGFLVVNNANPTNASTGMIAADSNQVYFSSAILGSGTYLPMLFLTGGSERMRINTAGNVGIGNTNPTTKLYVANGSNFNPAANVLGALTLQGSYGGGLILQDGSSAAGMWTTTNGATLILGAGGVPGTGFAATSMLTFTNAGNLSVPGCVTYNGGTSGTCLSDRRLKKDIRPFDLGLNKVLGLQPVLYKYNGLGGNKEDTNDRLGVIAQDVEKVAPEIVETREVKIHESDKESTTVKVVNYNAFTYMLMNAIKEFYAEFTSTKKDVVALQAANQKQQRDIASLKEQNEELKKRLDRLEKKLESK